MSEETWQTRPSANSPSNPLRKTFKTIHQPGQLFLLPPKENLEALTSSCTQPQRSTASQDELPSLPRPVAQKAKRRVNFTSPGQFSRLGSFLNASVLPPDTFLNPPLNPTDSSNTRLVLTCFSIGVQLNPLGPTASPAPFFFPPPFVFATSLPFPPFNVSLSFKLFILALLLDGSSSSSSTWSPSPPSSASS